MESELISLIHDFYQKGWAPATSTNYSFRQPETGMFTISRSGVDKSAFQAADLMTVDAEGRPIDGFQHLKPSAETLLHTMVYRLFPEVQVVLHTHTVANTVLSRRFEKKGAIRLEGYELLKAVGYITTHDTFIDLPVFSNAQDMPVLSAYIEQFLQENADPVPGFLLAGHGMYAWGASIFEAKRNTEALEFLLACELAEQSISVL